MTSEIEEDPSANSTLPSVSKISADIGNLAHWFIPLVAAAYAAGFLIVFSASKGFGIDSVELLQGKYIHVGSLFVMACVVVALPVFWLLQSPHFRNLSPDLRRSWLGTISSIVLYSSMLFTFYVIVAFSDRGFFHRHAMLVLGNFFPPMIYSSIRLLVLAKYIQQPKLPNVDTALAMVLCTVQLGLTYFTLRSDHLGNYLAEIFPISPPSGVYGFIALLVLSIVYGSLAMMRWRTLNDLSARFTTLISVACVVGVLVYLSILSFAYAVYPYIPSSKGGGGYLDAGAVRLFFREAGSDTNDVRRLMARDDSPFIMLYETTDSIFVASKLDSAAGGPEQWQKPGSKKPTVYEIRREAFDSVVYINSTPTPSSNSNLSP